MKVINGKHIVFMLLSRLSHVSKSNKKSRALDSDQGIRSSHSGSFCDQDARFFAKFPFPLASWILYSVCYLPGDA